MTSSEPPSQSPAVDIDKFLKKIRRSVATANEQAAQIEMELVRFDGENARIDFNVDWSHETVWATQKQMADLFGKDANAIGEHVGRLYDDRELDREATTRKFRVVRLEGGRPVSREIEHYNLDVILVVGYRVNGTKAAQFRQWANGVLKRYITDGFALNEQRLKNDPKALTELAAQVRRLRSEEIVIYEAVRDCFKLASTDYDKDAPAVRSFYAALQDKFLFAITGKTASQLILERADSTKHNMGVTAPKKALPSRQETKVGKSYLVREEIYILHILCEQFLLYAESKALRGKSMTMAELSAKLDGLLATNDYAVFPGYRDYLKDRAMHHAEREWERWSEVVAKGEHLPQAA
jgi:hypothetical protein